MTRRGSDSNCWEIVRSRFEQRKCPWRRSWEKDGCTILQVDGDFISSMRVPSSARSCICCLGVFRNDLFSGDVGTWFC